MRHLVFTLALLLTSFGVPAMALELQSASPSGVSGSYNSHYPVISGNGRYTVWGSGATNFLADIGACDPVVQTGSIYLRDNLTKTTELIVQNGGAAGFVNGSPAISTTGRHIAYRCGTLDICVLDRDTTTTEQLSTTFAYSSPYISADGRFVAYAGAYSQQSPFDPGYSNQIYVYDRCVSDGTPVDSCTPGKQLVSVNGSGVAADDITEFPDITPNGRFVVFSSQGGNLVSGVTSGNNIYVRDRCVTISGPVSSCIPSTRRVSVADDGSSPDCYPAGTQGAISDDGRYVAFDHCGRLVPEVTTTQFHIYVRDRDLDGNGIFDETGPGNTKTELVSQSTTGAVGDFSSSVADISADGQYVVFVSGAKNLSGPLESDLEYDVYLRDRLAHTTRRLSESPTGEPSHYPGGTLSYYILVSISDDGHVGVFDSPADNLVPKAQNSFDDVYLWSDCAAAAPTCGDSIVYYGCEDCDDGGAVDETNGCDSNCRATGCPNGVITTGETCDDGNRTSGDGCDTNCTPTICGNGIRTAGEACDDGNTASGDDCSPTCALELAKMIPGGGKATTDCWHEWRTEPAPLVDNKGLPKRELRCTDDDSSCDFGPAGDHACTFHVALCLNVQDSRLLEDGLPACTPDAIETFFLKQPKEELPKDAVETAIRDAFEAKFASLGACISGQCKVPSYFSDYLCSVDDDCDDLDDPDHIVEGVCKGRFGPVYDLIEQTNRCTGYMDLVVPLKAKSGSYSAGKRGLQLLVDPIPDPATGKLRKGDADKLKLICSPAPLP